MSVAAPFTIHTAIKEELKSRVFDLVSDTMTGGVLSRLSSPEIVVAKSKAQESPLFRSAQSPGVKPLVACGCFRCL